MYAITSTARWLRESPNPVPLVEALLFDAGVPLSIRQITERLELTEYGAGAALDSIKRRLDANDHGITLVRSGATAALAIRPEYQERIKRARRDGVERSKALIQEYLHVQHQRGRRPKTIESYKLFMERFADEIGRPIDEVTTRDIRRFLMDEEARGNQRSTIASKIHRLSSLYNWLEREEYIERNPMKRIDAPSPKESEPKHLSHEELELVRMACRKPIERLLVEVLYSSGIRRDEASNLDWSDVDFVERTLRIRDGKGGVFRLVPLSTRAIILLRQYRASRVDDNPWLFQSQFKQRMAVETIGRTMRILGERAGLEERLTPHRLRHSLATHLLESGVPLDVVQKILGHKKPSTTQIYAKRQMKQIEEYYRRVIQ